MESKQKAYQQSNKSNQFYQPRQSNKSIQSHQSYQSNQLFSRTTPYRSQQSQQHTQVQQKQTQIQNQNQSQKQSQDQTEALLADTTATLEEMLRMANETREMATNASLELNKQGEQLEHMREKMDTVDNNLAIAGKAMNNLEVKWYDIRTWF